MNYNAQRDVMLKQGRVMKAVNGGQDSLGGGLRMRGRYVQTTVWIVLDCRIVYVQKREGVVGCDAALVVWVRGKRKREISRLGSRALVPTSVTHS